MAMRFVAPRHADLGESGDGYTSCISQVLDLTGHGFVA